MNPKKQTRREFIKRGTLGALSASILASCATEKDKGRKPLAPEPMDAWGPQPIVGRSKGIPQRVLGSTGRKVTILGFGGSGVIQGDDTDTAVRLIHHAYEAGITYFDTARNYRNGQGERNYGAALAGLDRDTYYINTKIFSRSLIAATEDIEHSLEALRLDHVDCLLLHGLDTRESVRQAFADDGAIHALLMAKQEGLTKYIGFSGHANPESLEAALESSVDFDVAMMAINVGDHQKLAFEKRCYHKACAAGLGVVNMKTFGGTGGKIVKSKGGVFEPEELLRYAWSLRGHLAVVNINSDEELKTAVAAARNFEPITRQQKEQMERRVDATGLRNCLNFRNPYI